MSAPRRPRQPRGPAGRLARRWGPILWPSFLIAALATGVFFAHIDPEDLRTATFPSLQISRELGYSLGFFMFWATSAASSLLTARLLGPEHRRGA